jgi:hypothetical protein
MRDLLYSIIKVYAYHLTGKIVDFSSHAEDFVTLLDLMKV